MALEDRRLLSTIVVNNPTDTPVTGEIDLRQAIIQANTTGGAETIVFDKKVFKTPQTITLNGTQLELSDTTGTVTIKGPKAGVTISGGGLSRVFLIDQNVTASISGITITEGNAGEYEGGGIDNYGKLTISNSIFYNNSAFNGGAIENSAGTLTVSGSIFTSNHANDAAEINCWIGNPAVSAVSIVRKVFFATIQPTPEVASNYGTQTVEDSVFENNSAEGGGGIQNGGALKVSSSVFFDNSASTEPGGGIENGGTLISTNNVFYGNTPHDIGD